MRTRNSMMLVAVSVVAAFALSLNAAPQDLLVPAEQKGPPETNATDSSNSTAYEAASKPTSSETSSEVDNTDEDDDDDDDDDDGKSSALPDGMSDSLADFLLGILRGAANNATKAVQPAPAAASAGAAPSPSSPPSGTPSASSSSSSESSSSDSISQNITKEKDFDDDDDDYEYYYYTDEPWDDFTTTKGYDYGLSPTTKEPFSRNGKPNCAVQVDLSHYCIVDNAIAPYFNNDLTVSGLRSPIFDMGIVNRLKQCPRGEWCLGNEIEKLKGMGKNFYRGPYCDETMWECIFDILVQREQCQDKEFMFVVDAADLLCEMFDTEHEADIGNDCFAHALAALHVTYADFLAHNMSKEATKDQEPLCDGHTFRMTQTYLCTDNSCGRFFDAKLALERFNRWGWFMDNVDEIVDECDLDDDVCGGMGVPQVASTFLKSWFGMTTTSFWSDYESDDYEDDYKGVGGDSQIGGNVGGKSMDGGDESMMVALSVGSAVGLLFMVLGLLFWRRSKRRNLYHYRSEGYSKQLPPDAAHLLPHPDYDRDLD